MYLIINSRLESTVGIFSPATGNPVTENVFNSDRENNDKMLK